MSIERAIVILILVVAFLLIVARLGGVAW